MSNTKIVAQAMVECGIGSRFSKFRLAQFHQYFSLMDINAEHDTEFCLIAHDKIDRKRYDAITGVEALAFGQGNPEWASYLHTAQKVMAKIVRRKGSDFENQYLVDPVHGSVYVVNRMFVIEVSPKKRPAPDLPSQVAFNYLEQHGAMDISGKCVIKLFTVHGRVVIIHNGVTHNTLMTPDEFEERYEDCYA